MLLKLKAECLRIPEDLVEVGYVSGAYGIRGWIRVRPYSAGADALLTVNRWWLDKLTDHAINAVQVKWRGDTIVACLEGVTDRNMAEALRGSVVRISRADFPALEENEYYWVDLIGLDVINERGIRLGTVSNLIDNNVHLILQVQAKLPDGTQKELLIPFVGNYVGNIDIDKGNIVVDWELDY